LRSLSVSVKSLCVSAVIFFFLIALGCSGTDKVGPGTNKGGDTSRSSAATAQDYSFVARVHFDSEANGGSTLGMAMPYSTSPALNAVQPQGQPGAEHTGISPGPGVSSDHLCGICAL